MEKIIRVKIQVYPEEFNQYPELSIYKIIKEQKVNFNTNNWVAEEFAIRKKKELEQRSDLFFNIKIGKPRLDAGNVLFSYNTLEECYYIYVNPEDVFDILGRASGLCLVYHDDTKEYVIGEYGN